MKLIFIVVLFLYLANVHGFLKRVHHHRRVDTKGADEEKAYAEAKEKAALAVKTAAATKIDGADGAFTISSVSYQLAQKAVLDMLDAARVAAASGSNVFTLTDLVTVLFHDEGASESRLFEILTSAWLNVPSDMKSETRDGGYAIWDNCGGFVAMCQCTLLGKLSKTETPATVETLRGVLTGGPKLVTLSVGPKYSHTFVLDVLPTGGRLTLLQANADPSYFADAWLLEARRYTTVDAFLTTFGNYLAARTAADITSIYDQLFSVTGKTVQANGDSTETALYRQDSYSASALDNLRASVQLGWFCWRNGLVVSDSDKGLSTTVRVVAVIAAKKFVLPWRSKVSALKSKIVDWLHIESDSLNILTTRTKAVMDPDTILDEYSICTEGSVIVANLNPNDLLVEVVELSGVADVYRCSLKSTIADLKQQILERHQLTGYDLRWKGRALVPTDTLLALGVSQQEARFNMVITLTGG